MHLQTSTELISFVKQNCSSAARQRRKNNELVNVGKIMKHMWQSVNDEEQDLAATIQASVEEQQRKDEEDESAFPEEVLLLCRIQKTPRWPRRCKQTCRKRKMRMWRCTRCAKSAGSSNSQRGALRAMVLSLDQRMSCCCVTTYFVRLSHGTRSACQYPFVTCRMAIGTVLSVCMRGPPTVFQFLTATSSTRR